MGNHNEKKEEEIHEPTATEIKVYFQVIQLKLSLFRNKKVYLIKNKKNEIIKYIKEQNLDVAKAKMDSILREEDTITCYDILAPFCEILKERVTYLMSNNECPVDLRAQLDSVIYASTRIEMEELQKLREFILRKYGEYYVSKADNNTDRFVNVNLVEKLRIKTPNDQWLIMRLKQLCKEKNVQFEYPEEINENQLIKDFGGINPYGPDLNMPINPYGPPSSISGQEMNMNNNLNLPVNPFSGQDNNNNPYEQQTNVNMDINNNLPPSPFASSDNSNNNVVPPQQNNQKNNEVSYNSQQNNIYGNSNSNENINVNVSENQNASISDNKKDSIIKTYTNIPPSDSNNSSSTKNISASNNNTILQKDQNQNINPYNPSTCSIKPPEISNKNISVSFNENSNEGNIIEHPKILPPITNPKIIKNENVGENNSSQNINQSVKGEEKKDMGKDEQSVKQSLNPNDKDNLQKSQFLQNNNQNLGNSTLSTSSVVFIDQINIKDSKIEGKK